MHDLEHAQIDRRILFRALKLLEETDAAHPFVEEANQHAVLRPDPAVGCRQILHDVVGGGGERVFRRLDLIVGSAGRARVDFELLDRLRDLIHKLACPRAHQRCAQAPQHDEKRRGCPHERARSHRDEVHGHMRRHGRRRHRRRRLGSNIEVVRRPRGHPVIPATLPLALAGRRRVGRRDWRRRRIGDRRGRRRGWRGSPGGRTGGGIARRWRRGAPSSRIGTNDRPVAPPERIVFGSHRRSSLTAQSSIWSSGQSPAKCMPIAVA